jgi:hypothetical protein
MIKETVTPKSRESIYGLMVRRELALRKQNKGALDRYGSKKKDEDKRATTLITDGSGSRSVLAASWLPSFRRRITKLSGNCLPPLLVSSTATLGKP